MLLRKTNLTMVLLLMLVCISSLAFGASDPITGVLTWIETLLTSTVSRIVAVLAITFLGYMAFVGKLTWEKAGMFVAGIVLVFGGAQIINVITSAF